MVWDVVLVQLPYHGRRAPRGAYELSSSLFPSANVIRTNEAIAQMISDLRELRHYLEQRGALSIGCMGMSLGAYMASLWASLDPLSFCVPIVPMASMADLAWDVFKKDPAFEEIRRAGLQREMFEQAFYIHSPLNYRPKLSKDRMLIIAGTADKIVPPHQPKMLWEHWQRPSMVWLRGGHIVQVKGSIAMNAIMRFFDGLGYID